MQCLFNTADEEVALRACARTGIACMLMHDALERWRAHLHTCACKHS